MTPQEKDILEKVSQIMARATIDSLNAHLKCLAKILGLAKMHP